MKIDDSYWYGYKDGKTDGYNKGIDDFAERIIEVYSYLPASIVKELAEQLKSKTKL